MKEFYRYTVAVRTMLVLKYHYMLRVAVYLHRDICLRIFDVVVNLCARAATLPYFAVVFRHDMCPECGKCFMD